MHIAASTHSRRFRSDVLTAAGDSSGEAVTEPTDGAVRLRGELRYSEPMARHVTWRAGGRARCAYVPADVADLQAFLRGLPENEMTYFVGLGSNLLVRDG